MRPGSHASLNLIPQLGALYAVAFAGVGAMGFAAPPLSDSAHPQGVVTSASPVAEDRGRESAAAELRLRRANPYAAMVKDFNLSEAKARRLRELLRVPEVAILEVEGELSRGAYRSRQEAIDIYTLACNEAETEIASLLTPIQYARLQTVRDELPARRFVLDYDTFLTSEGGAVAGQSALPDEAFAALLALAHSICRRQGVAPDYGVPEGVADEVALARYLEAKTTADAAIARGAATFLTSVQTAALTKFQATQRESLATLWRQRPAVPWVRRR